LDPYTYTISVLPTPRILNGHSPTDRKLCRFAAKNESTLAQSFTMDEFGAGTLSLCRVSDGADMNISKPSVNKSNTGVRTLISHHNRRTLVTLKILFFDESHARCVRLGRSAYNTTDHSGVLHAHMITNLYIDWYRSRVLTL